MEKQITTVYVPTEETCTSPSWYVNKEIFDASKVTETKAYLYTPEEHAAVQEFISHFKSEGVQNELKSIQIIKSALEKSKLRMEQDAETWGDSGLLPEDPVYLAICEAIGSNKKEQINPYKDLKCNYVYDYCDPKTCNCSKSFKWKQEHEAALSKEDKGGNGWISVEDRFPPDYERVLFLDSRDNNINLGYFVWSQTPDSHITHWQKLPPKP